MKERSARLRFHPSGTRIQRALDHQGSVLVVVMWMLFAISLLVFAAQKEAIEGHRGAVAGYHRAVTRWIARGGVAYGVGHLAKYAPLPDQAVRYSSMPSRPAFYKPKKIEGVPYDWFIADRPYPDPSREDSFGIRSEQGRLPLNALTDEAIDALFTTSATSFRNYVANQRTASDHANSGGAQTMRMDVFRHPFELLAIPGMDRSLLMGQDQNLNAVLDPFETSIHAPIVFPPVSGPNRGIFDHVTTFSDGRFNPYDASVDDIRIFFGSSRERWTGKTLENRDARPPLTGLVPGSDPESQTWIELAKTSMTNVSRYFRIQCFGSYNGDPISRVVLVTEYMEEDDPADNWFRIAHWREE